MTATLHLYLDGECRPVLTVADVAALAGIDPKSVSAYLSRGYLPLPDVHVGRTPLWTDETIDTWLASRPGRGVRRHPQSA